MSWMDKRECYGWIRECHGWMRECYGWIRENVMD